MKGCHDGGRNRRTNNSRKKIRKKKGKVGMKDGRGIRSRKGKEKRWEKRTKGGAKRAVSTKVERRWKITEQEDR